MLDPYRLPPRQPDNLVLPFVRPDVPLNGPFAEPYVLPGFILTEDGLAYILAEDGRYVVTET